MLSFEERTGYPTQRSLQGVEDMTETQYRDVVAWVQAHPFYKYEGSLSSSGISENGHTIKNGEISSPVEAAKV